MSAFYVKEWCAFHDKLPDTNPNIIFLKRNYTVHYEDICRVNPDEIIGSTEGPQFFLMQFILMICFQYWVKSKETSWTGSLLLAAKRKELELWVSFSALVAKLFSKKKLNKFQEFATTLMLLVANSIANGFRRCFILETASSFELNVTISSAQCTDGVHQTYKILIWCFCYHKMWQYGTNSQKLNFATHFPQMVL